MVYSGASIIETDSEQGSTYCGDEGDCGYDRQHKAPCTAGSDAAPEAGQDAWPAPLPHEGGRRVEQVASGPDPPAVEVGHSDLRTIVRVIQWPRADVAHCV